MTILGTKKFWIQPPGPSRNQADNQVVKNSGYLNIQLFSVNYKSDGNFWQRIFGGSDTIALSTNVKYQTSAESIESSSIQDVRQVDVNRTYNFGLQRNIAIKIPANADALELTVRMSAVRNDRLQAKFDMLNKPEFQTALQLAPTVVGQVLTITSLAKKLFTESDPDTQLEATYAGIISSQRESNPVPNGKLTSGYLLLISTDEGLSFTTVDESKFSLRGDTLYYGPNQVENTYVVFNISFEHLKGDDENSSWFKKYAAALSYLDKISTVDDKSKITNIYMESKNLWIEGNALLEADSTYLHSEKVKIKAAMFGEISKKCKDMQTQIALPDVRQLVQTTSEILTQISGLDTLDTIKTVLPKTGNYLFNKLNIDPRIPLANTNLSEMEINTDSTSAMLLSDSELYFEDLKKEGKEFKLKV